MLRRSSCSATAWPRPAWATRSSSKSNSTATWRAAAKSSMPRWYRLRFSATSARKPTPSRQVQCLWLGSRTSARKRMSMRAGRKKHGKSYFGYKLHASVDKRYKLMRKIAVTHAAVADTTVFESLLDRANTSRAVYADRGYPTAEREARLKQQRWRVHIQRKGSATKGISDTEKKRNRRIATPRPSRTRVRCAGANGWQAGALHGHRPRHLRFEPERRRATT